MKINRFLDFSKYKKMFCYSNLVVQNDLKGIIQAPLSWNDLNNKNILVTGANGMIATYLVYFLMFLNLVKGFNIKIFALSRNKDKAKMLFNDFSGDSRFCFLNQDVCDSIIIEDKINYIFHFAGNASPYYINNDPVGIMKSNLLGTINVLEFARINTVDKIIFASTREVYGDNKLALSLSENSFGSIDCLDNRSCYPESKRAAEALFKSYFTQYGIDFNILRIAHSYGPGMKLENDGRVMADLLSYIVRGENIILKSTGDAIRAFCYITDTICGLFYVLQKGKSGEAYNLSNEKEEISIFHLAELLVDLAPKNDLRVNFQILDKQDVAYCNYKRVKMDTSKLEALGWKPTVLLKDGLLRTIQSLV